MSNKKDHNIDFFRGNLSKEDLENINNHELEDSYTFSDFNFNKKNREEKMRALEEERLMNEQAMREKILADKRAEEIKRAQYNRLRKEEMQKKLDQQNQNAFQQKEARLNQDPNIASGKRKPLKPINEDSNKMANGNNNNFKRPKKRNKKKKKVLLIILMTILLLLIAFISALLIIKNTAKPLNVVMIGVDQRTNQKDSEIRADALMNISVGSKDNKILMASIPRDTYTYIPCEEKEDKITHAYAYGAINWEDKGGGISCTVKSVNSLLDTTSDRYVKLNFDQMVGIIDALGGVQMKATATFCEQNSKGKKNSYCYKKGQSYKMDGEMALAYSRHRKSDNDIERGLRQQEVFKAMISRVKSAKIWEMPSIYIKVTQMLESNLSQIEMLQVAMVYATDGDTENYKFDWEGMYLNGVAYVKLDDVSIQKYQNKIKQLD